MLASTFSPLIFFTTARNDPHPDFGKTALQTAVSAGHTGIVKLILETAETSGADKVISNHEDENGEAPIHVASRCGSIDIMELLVMHGANLGLIDGRGRTCLHCAAQAGQAECLLFALDCGADEYIEAFSNDGFTPLHLAVRTNKTDCVLVLLQAGADVSTETMSGANVYNLASKQRCERLMKLLLEYDVSSASEGEDSYYDTSYDSISSEEDMFRGLNTYHVGSTQQMGGLLSPVNRPQTNLKYRMPSNNIGNHHSQWTQMNSPIAGVNHRFGNGDRQFNDSITRHLESNDDGDFYFGGDLWKIYVTEDGHTYFYNVNKDSSSWQDPRSSMKHVSFSEQRCAQTPASPGQGGNHDRPVILSPASCKRKLTAIPHPSNTQTKDGITRGSLSPGVPSVASPVPGRQKSQLNETVSGSSAIAPANHQSSAARNIHVNLARDKLLMEPSQASIPHPLVKSHNNRKSVPSNSHSCAARGLNTYHVGSTQQMGGLLSPVNRPHSNNIGNHHSQWTQMNSPIAGVNHRFGNGDRQFNDSITRHLESNDDGDFYFGGDLWKIYVTEDGHTYFYNVNKDSSSWQDPRSSMKHVSFSEQRCAQTPASPGQGGNHDRPVILSPASCKRKLTAIPHPSNTQTKDGITRGSLSPGVPSVASPVPGRQKSQLNETVSGSSAIAPANHQSSAARNIHVNLARDKLLMEPSQASIPHPLVKSHNNRKSVPSNSHSCAAKQDAPDPKSMLLAQINSRSAIVGSSIQSTPQPAMCDLESLRLAQRKSRSGGDVGVTQSSVSPPTTQEKGDHASAKDDPKSLLLAQIKSRSSSAEGVTHSLLWSATEEDTTAKSENKAPKSSQSNDPEMAKYVKMKAVGIPLPAIKQKMKLDGINPGKIKRFESFDSSSDATPNQKENVAPHDNVIKSPKQQSKDQVKAALIQDESTKKFMRMASVGVPAKAVSHKMQQEGVDISKIAMFNEYHGLVTACTKPPASSKSQSTTFTKEDLSKDSTFDKYIKMTKVGVPCMAIAVKMKNDGVDKEKIIMFSEAFGLKPANRGSQATSKPFPKPWRGSRRASKALQKIHWTSVSEDKLQNSLWASGDVSEKDDIKDSEIEEIESLFSLSPIRRAAAGNKKIATNKSSKATSVLDPKRANNTAIALAQFRAYKSFDDLCQAVASLDSTYLDLEKLHNMVLLLPRSDEIASLKQYKDQSDGLSLGRAELWFLAVMKVPCFQQKLHTFKYTLQFDELTQSLTKSLNLLKKACREVTESKKLAGLLRRLLAIGNLMNESCQKPPTMGITLDSLIKTAKKKGSDGKTTVLDLLVSTSIENKLDIVHFWSDMPSVGESTKCDLEDYRSLLREIETGAQSVECFIEAEKSQEHSCTAESLSQLVPFMKRVHGEIDSLKKLFSIVERRVQSLCSFFAEDAKTCKASSIFAVLIDFSRLVDQAKQKAHRKQNAMNRRSSMTMNRPTSAPGL